MRTQQPIYQQTIYLLICLTSMKKIFALIIAVATLCSCKDYTYRIDGTIDGAANGDSVSLCYSSDGQDVEVVEKVALKDGKFTFTGEEKKCKIFYIGHHKGADSQYALFFLEPGNIDVKISKDTYRITGTPTNDINTAIEDSLTQFVATIIECEEMLQNDTTLTEEAMLKIANRSYEAQSNAMKFVNEAIDENIENMVGLYLLVQYCDIFSDDELDALIARIPEENIDRENNPLYDILLQIKAIRNEPSEFEDISNAIENEWNEGSETEESDIVE